MARKPLDQDLYDSVVAEAKRKFAVWPSAYASGWVVKTYKDRGGRYAGAGRKERAGLTKWFGENWVDLSRPTADGGYEPCGRKRSDDPTDYPKCRPLREALRMSPSEVKDAIKRKRAAEAGAPGRGSRARAPKRVATYRKNPAPDAVFDNLVAAGLPDVAAEKVVETIEKIATCDDAQKMSGQCMNISQELAHTLDGITYVDAYGDAQQIRAFATQLWDVPARLRDDPMAPGHYVVKVESDGQVVWLDLTAAQFGTRGPMFAAGPHVPRIVDHFDDLRANRNPRKPPPLTERELEDLPRANAFWMDFEIENGPEYLPAAMQDAQWPADRDDVELARVVLAFCYRNAPGNY